MSTIVVYFYLLYLHVTTYYVAIAFKTRCVGWDLRIVCIASIADTFAQLSFVVVGRNSRSRTHRYPNSSQH